MGQAKQRKAEILALKQQGPKKSTDYFTKPRKLMSFGAFFKDDCDDGVSIYFHTFKDPKPGFTKMIHEATDMCRREMIREYREGVITLKDIWDQLHACIHNFNIKCFGTSVRPQRANYNIDVIKCMEEIIVIVGNIWVLTELGQIKNDNFNGMSFAYTYN